MFQWWYRHSNVAVSLSSRFTRLLLRTLNRFILLIFQSEVNMAIPVLKCPFLSQLTLQQVRASAPHILNAGVESCPIFSQFARKISTSNVHDTGNVSTTQVSSSSSPMARPLSMDEIKAVHEKILEQRSQPFAAAHMKVSMPTMQSAFHSKKPNLYGESTPQSPVVFRVSEKSHSFFSHHLGWMRRSSVSLPEIDTDCTSPCSYRRGYHWSEPKIR